MAKAFGVGSGIWLEEEWPKLLNRPYLSTSINEMWGKRYHQVSDTVTIHSVWVFITDFQMLRVGRLSEDSPDCTAYCH